VFLLKSLLKKAFSIHHFYFNIELDFLDNKKIKIGGIITGKEEVKLSPFADYFLHEKSKSSAGIRNHRKV
jgi:hypothetical protein